MVIMAFVWHFIQANAITYPLDYQLVNYNNGISVHFYIISFWNFRLHQFGMAPGEYHKLLL